MDTAPSPLVPQLASASPPMAVNLDTANMGLLMHSLVQLAGQPRPQLRIDCGALERLRTLGVCDVVSRLLMLRQTGAGVCLCNVGPLLQRSLHLLQVSSLFALVG